jgi:hypothetical protein
MPHSQQIISCSDQPLKVQLALPVALPSHLTEQPGLQAHVFVHAAGPSRKQAAAGAIWQQQASRRRKNSENHTKCTLPQLILQAWVEHQQQAQWPASYSKQEIRHSICLCQAQQQTTHMLSLCVRQPFHRREYACRHVHASGVQCMHCTNDH